MAEDGENQGFDLNTLYGLSAPEIKAIADEIPKVQQRLLKSKKANLKKALVKIADEYGVEMQDISQIVAELIDSTQVRYQDPDDPSNTWTGRGRKPKWLSQKVEDGAAIEAFEV